MFYVYTLLFPIIIVIASILVFRRVYNFKLINQLLIVSFFMYLYSTLMYYLEVNDLIEGGWISYSIFFFCFRYKSFYY